LYSQYFPFVFSGKAIVCRAFLVMRVTIMGVCLLTGEWDGE
jgi:hypothetical protein